MSLLDLGTLPADGDTIDAADVNNPLNAIKTVINGNIDDDNIAAGVIAAGANITVKASAYHSAAQNNVNNSYVKVTLGTENYDIGSNFDTTLSRFVVPTTGYYLVNTQIEWTGGKTGTTAYDLAIYIDGSLAATTEVITTQATTFINLSRILYLTASQYVELYQLHNDATNVPDLPATTDTFLDIHLLST